MAPGIGIGIGIGAGLKSGGGIDWSSYWTPPSALTLTVVSDTAITLDWTGGKATSIERSADGVTYAEIDTVALGTTTYNDTGLTEATHYWYRVREYSGSNYSSYSNVADDYTDPAELANAWAIYDFVDADNLTKDGSERVAQVTDLTGNGNHYLQADDAKKPIHVNGYVLSDGSNDTMATGAKTLDVPITIYTVFEVPTIGCKEGNLYDGNNLYSCHTIFRGATPSIANVQFFKGSFLPATPMAYVRVDNKTLLTHVVNGANSLLKISSTADIIEDAGTGYGNPSGFTLGSLADGSNNCYVRWYGQIIFASAHDAATRLKIQNYLTRKYRDTFDAWTVAGQSNALGKDTVANITGLDYKVTIPNGIIFNYTSSKFETYVPGVNAQTGANEFGVENSFLSNMVTYKSSRIYVIKYALGSSKLATDAGGDDWNPDNAGECYDDLLVRFTNGLAELARTINRLRFKGIIWIQGESDSVLQVDANAYYANLVDFMESNFVPYLNSLNVANDIEETIQKIIVGVANSGLWTYRNTVIAAQQLYCTNYDGIYIDTATYAVIVGNEAHYDADSLVQIGIDAYNGVKDL